MSERLPDGACVSPTGNSESSWRPSDEQRALTALERRAAHELRGQQREALEHAWGYLFDRPEFMSSEVVASRLGVSHEDAVRLIDAALDAVARRVEELRRDSD